MWIERATVGELSTRPLGANPEPPSTDAASLVGQSRVAILIKEWADNSGRLRGG